MFTNAYLDFMMSIPPEYQNAASIMLFLFNLELLLGLLQIYVLKAWEKEIRGY